MLNDKGEEIVVEKPVVGQEIKAPDPVVDELRVREEQRTNLEKAIVEAQTTLRDTREAIKKAKGGVVDEEIPQIDDTDPSAKAWNKRIQDTTAPISSQLERQKEEVRTFALRSFLRDKPALAKNPEKLKELMSNYDRIKIATEQTQEGVLLDLEKAYGATFHEELISAARQGRIDQAREDMIASDIAVDKGASSESSAKPTKRQYTNEEKQILATWELHGAPKVE